MSKRKESTSTSTTRREVVTPTNPEWVTRNVQGLTERIGQLGQGDPYSLVAPASGLEQTAAASAQGLGRYGFGYDDAADVARMANGYGHAYDQAADWMRGVAGAQAPQVQAASLLDGLEAYYNPYRGQVTDAAMADFDAEAGRTRASQDLALASQGAFGGSGAAITRSLTEGELARARNTQLSNLLADMFTTSTGLASQDADRRQEASVANAQFAGEHAARQLQAAGALAGMASDNADRQLAISRMLGDLTSARSQSDREDIAAQAALGQQMRGIDQAYRMAPYTALAAQVDMLSGLPLSLFNGRTSDMTENTNSTTTQKPSFLDSVEQVFRIAEKGVGIKNAMSGPSGGAQ